MTHTPHVEANYSQQTTETEQVGQKSFIATWLLSWFLGSLAIDRFYLGKIGTGILKLITVGGFGIWTLVDLILTLTGNQRDSKGLKLEGYEQHKKTAWIVTGGLIVLQIIVYIIVLTTGALSLSMM